MSVTPIGAVFAGLVAAALFAALAGRMRAPAVVLGAAVPMSASAAAILGFAGGASLPVSVLAAGGLVAACGFHAMREEICGHRLRISGAALALLVFTLIALLGAYALPRIFEGATLTFPLDRNAIGVTDAALKLPLLPLAPRSGALTQSAYLLSSTLIFLSALWLARRDPRAFPAALWAATAAQIMFGVLDAVGWSGMELIRTATYQIAPSQGFAGFVRLIGAATEPSQFGLVSSALAAWHLWQWRETGAGRSGCAAFLMAVMAVGSLSTTAIVALAAALIWFAAGALARPRGPGFASMVSGLALLALTGWSWALLGPQSGAVEAALSAMFSDKLASESGLERARWASQALVNFAETYGFGTGLGSAKASGWATAILGQTGVPGAVLMLVFLALIFLPATDNRAARAAAAIWLIGALMSEARVDLGYLFFICAAATVAARSHRIARFSDASPSFQRKVPYRFADGRPPGGGGTYQGGRHALG